MKTYKLFQFNYNVHNVADDLLWMNLQGQPIRRAQLWGFCEVWALWPEHWDQLYHPLVSKTAMATNAAKIQNMTYCSYCMCVWICLPCKISSLQCTYNNCCVFLHSILDSWSSDLLSPYIGLFHYSSGSPENSQQAKGGVKDWLQTFFVFELML